MIAVRFSRRTSQLRGNLSFRLSLSLERLGPTQLEGGIARHISTASWANSIASLLAAPLLLPRPSGIDNSSAGEPSGAIPAGLLFRGCGCDGFRYCVTNAWRGRVSCERFQLSKCFSEHRTRLISGGHRSPFHHIRQQAYHFAASSRRCRLPGYSDNLSDNLFS